MRCVVVAGASGAGKSTLGAELAQALGWAFIEGDDLHPSSNIEKMRSGVALTDQDRAPWLAKVRERVENPGDGLVITCSALRRSYRDFLASRCTWLAFCLVEAPREVIAARLRTRTDHYMPASLLESQLAALEPLEPDEPGFVVDATTSPEEMVSAALRRVRQLMAGR